MFNWKHELNLRLPGRVYGLLHSISIIQLWIIIRNKSRSNSVLSQASNCVFFIFKRFLRSLKQFSLIFLLDFGAKPTTVFIKNSNVLELIHEKLDIVKLRLNLFYFSQPSVFTINLQHSVYFYYFSEARLFWHLQTESKYSEICLNCTFISLQPNFGKYPLSSTFRLRLVFRICARSSQ